MLNIEMQYGSCFSLLGINSKERKAGTQTLLVRPCSQGHYSPYPKGGHNSGVHRQVNG